MLAGKPLCTVLRLCSVLAAISRMLRRITLPGKWLTGGSACLHVFVRLRGDFAFSRFCLATLPIPFVSGTRSTYTFSARYFRLPAASLRFSCFMYLCAYFSRRCAYFSEVPFVRVPDPVPHLVGPPPARLRMRFVHAFLQRVRRGLNSLLSSFEPFFHLGLQ